MSHLQLLSDLPNGTHATVAGLVSGATAMQSATAQRLGELGFIPGEPVQMLRRGPGGREPLAVRVGDTQFALRRVEADCVQVRAADAP